jgi:hypothetical protein
LNDMISRRAALRMAAGVAAAAAAGGVLLTATPASALQHLWSSCTRCRGLWFTGNGTRGGCPAGDLFNGGHQGAGLDWMLKSVDDFIL